MLPKENQDELFYHIALSFVNEVGPVTARSLLARFGSAEGVFQAKDKDLNSVEGMGAVRVASFKDKLVFEKAEQEIGFCEKNNIIPILFNTPAYPRRFMNCEDAPILLYNKGNANLNTGKIISVIGTRKSSDYGERCCELLFSGLKGTPDLLVVSGLALGIDTLAHRYSLKNNIPTLGVLGHSLDAVYPSSNRHLASDMLDNGGLLSEFPSGTKPDKQNFPIRNRIVAGMSDITIVVESDIKGGAMITAYIAQSYGRDIAAFPGRVFDSKSSGTNHLIRKNMAALITSTDDLLELMNWGAANENKKAVQVSLFAELLPEEQPLFDLLHQKDSLHTDELMLQTGYSNSQLASVLLQMEMKGLIKSLPGKNYRLN